MAEAPNHLVECNQGHPHLSDRLFPTRPTCPGRGFNFGRPSSVPPPPPPMAKPGAQFRELAAAITLLGEGVKDLAGALREFVRTVDDADAWELDADRGGSDGG